MGDAHASPGRAPGPDAGSEHTVRQGRSPHLWATANAAKRQRQAWLGDFLRRRRESLNPRDLGLVSSGRRRTPGLRREEVAALANVGVSWYTWLEQGRDITVSAAVVESIASALRLSGADLQHYYELLGQQAPTPPLAAVELRGTLERIVGSIDRLPAYVADRYWNVLAANDIAAFVFDLEVGTNCLTKFFSDHEYAQRYPFRDLSGQMMVAQFRRQAIHFGTNAILEAMIEELSQVSDAFRDLWESHLVGQEPHVDVVYDHTTLGRLTFESVAVTPIGGDDLMVFIYVPSVESGTADVLRRVL